MTLFEEKVFLSTPSARRATTSPALTSLICDISIHALREEGDYKKMYSLLLFCDFYPRPPRGGRLYAPLPERTWRGYFYPRPPRGGRRIVVQSVCDVIEFLSTPSARRATWHCIPDRSPKTHFYPRPPRGGRPTNRRTKTMTKEISIHALREEGDRIVATATMPSTYFYPRPPRGGRLYYDVQ